METNKQWKRVPFDIELAKKIQSGEVEGRIVTREGKLARILCDDFYTNDVFKVVAAIRETNSEKIIRVNANGDYNTTTCSHMDLVIELPEETPKHEFKPFDKVLVRRIGDYGNTLGTWTPALFQKYVTEYGKIEYLASGLQWHECIPYEGNEDLVGTTNKPKEG